MCGYVHWTIIHCCQEKTTLAMYHHVTIFRLITTAATFICFQSLVAEELFFHRDHHDQPIYSQKSIPGGFKGVNNEPQLVVSFNYNIPNILIYISVNKLY